MAPPPKEPVKAVSSDREGARRGKRGFLALGLVVPHQRGTNVSNQRRARLTVV